MRARVLAPILAGAFVLAAAPARAGHPQERKGFWIGFGLGFGSADATCSNCAQTARDGSYTFSLKLGGTLNKRVLLGAEFNAWASERENTDVTVSIGNVSGTVTFYPWAASGFFVKAGGGLSYLDQDFQEGTVQVTVSKTGWGLLTGLGYDWRLGRNISVTPYFNFYYGQPGDIEFGGANLVNWTQNVLDFGVGITIH